MAAGSRQGGPGPDPETVSDGSGTEGAARVADVLMLFTSGGDVLGVSAIARELGLSKAVVHRILRSLANRQLLAVDEASRGYRLGPASAALGARALRGSSLRSIGLPVITALQQETGETTTLSSVVRDGRVYLAQVESLKEIKMTVELGTRFPLHAGSSGKAILAFLPAARRAAVLEGTLAQLTPHTVVDASRLAEELETIRHTGIAHSRGERQADAGSVAAPVFGVEGAVVGSVSVCGPVSRVDEAARNRIAPALGRAADTISCGLGWAGGLPEVTG